MADDVKRLHFFTGQFLDAKDFTDEQTYHREMRWRGNRLLYGPGVLEGLDVTKTADKQITVSAGVAVDDLGRELVVVPPATDPQTVPSGLTGEVNVVISFQEVPTDSRSVAGYVGATRVAEKPKIEIQSGPATGSQILLATLTLDGSGNVTDKPPDKPFPNRQLSPIVVGTGKESENRKLILRGPNSPTGPDSFQDLSYEFRAAGSAKIRAYCDDFWGTHLQLLTNAHAARKDDPQVRLHIDEGGNVGIGTTDPGSYRLMVSGGDTRLAGKDQEQSLFGLDRLVGLNDLRFYVDDVGTKELLHLADRGLSIDPANANNGSLDSGGLSFGSNSGEGIASGRTAGVNQYGLDLYTNRAVRMSITNAGNVGIGTVDPGSYRLMVSGGDTRLAGKGEEQSLFGLDRLVGVNDLRFYVDDVGTKELLHLADRGLSIDPANANNGSLDSGGLSFGSNSGEGIASRRTAGTPDTAGVNRYGLDFYTGSAVRMSITNGGSVGIGTTEPKAKLDIEGDALLGYEATLTGIGLPTADFGAPLKSGFYQNNGHNIPGDTNKIPGEVPDTSHNWTHLIAARHSNTANNHQLQIAASYKANDKLYFRKIEASGTSNPTWNELATRGTNQFTGDQSIVQGTLTVSPHLVVHGDIFWDYDRSGESWVRLGHLQIAWGKGTFSVPTDEVEFMFAVPFPTNFGSALPAVTVTIDDPGYGTDIVFGGAGAFEISASGFTILYKKALRSDNSSHIINYSWIAIGHIPL